MDWQPIETPMRALSHGRGALALQQDGHRVITINPAGIDGPHWEHIDGADSPQVLSCVGCKHLALHDYHYPYCSAQEAENQHDGKKYYYPWRGAGKHIYRSNPNSGCPLAPPPKDPK